MADILTLTDSTFEAQLPQDKPVLLLFSGGDDLRSDFSVAYKKARAEHQTIAFIEINPRTNPKTAAHFNIGSKAVLIAYYKGEELARRSRPWGADIPLVVELLEKAYQADAPAPVLSTHTKTHNQKDKTLVETTPVHVTDQTFQQEVIDYELPVLVDFWAEWCGPCRMVGPILDKLAAEYAGKIRIAKVDVDSNPGLSQAFRVMSIPTIMMFKQRNIVFSQPGALPEPAFRDLIDQLIALEIPAQDEPETSEEPAN